jgi:formiminotetrahydrofolate cyclodeaminase
VSALRTAAEGAYFNVRINLPAIIDEDFKKTVRKESDTLLNEIRSAADKTVESVIKILDQAEKQGG